MKLAVVAITVVAAISSATLSAKPLVIAHRGASGYLPEHTLAGYERAIDMGADYIEPDLVITKDGKLIARHDHYLGTTTDVADRAEFADRKKSLEGRADWFSEDFTLAEIKTLRARQAFPGRTREFDGKYAIPTFEEVIDLVKRKQQQSGRTIGIYPETKDPGYFESLGFDFAKLLLDALERADLNRPGAAVYIQSFEPEILEKLNRLTALPLIMLVTPVSKDRPATPNIPLDRIVEFADGIGATKTLLIDATGHSSGVVEAAHRRGLLVHGWTFRSDAYPRQLFSSPEDEIKRYLEIGIDGFFTDFPDVGVKTRDELFPDP